VRAAVQHGGGRRLPAVAEGQQRGQVRAGRAADHGDARRIDAQARRLLLQPAPGALHILQVLRVAHLGREPVVDGEAGEALGRQRFHQRRVVGARAGAPAAAVDEEQRAAAARHAGRGLQQVAAQGLAGHLADRQIALPRRCGARLTAGAQQGRDESRQQQGRERGGKDGQRRRHRGRIVRSRQCRHALA
jgi:hypothetical protein